MKVPDKSELIDKYGDLDDETMDEMLYDAEAVEKCLNDIYKKTYTNRAMNILYVDAAAKMISLDAETGLAVLMSYDYFSVFSKLLKRLEEDPKVIIQNTDEYKAVMDKLH
jgi:hypothetical protein